MKTNDEANNANKQNMVKNPNWRKADRLAIGVGILELSRQRGTWTCDLRITSPTPLENVKHNG